MSITDDGTRASGILLHPTSFPGRFGVGDVGPAAIRWLDFLSSTGTKLWQILPLGPTGYGDSPYQCFSSFAGNPYLISPEGMLDEGIITKRDLGDVPSFPSESVDYGPVIQWKVSLLDRAYDRFKRRRAKALRAEYAEFREQHETWLEDFALFMALKDRHDLRPWSTWDRELRLRDPAAMTAVRAEESERSDRHAFRQFLFFRQWAGVRAHAASVGISIIGDIPIFVAADSADVWANQDLFRLDEEGRPKVVAGVPPDYFSATGQLWGNPLYDWERHADTGYAWWIDRIETMLALVDVIRVDHFRAFADYWEIPGDAPTAETGRWLDGPGMPLFEAVQRALGELPIIAEDLGDLSPKVPALLRATGLPGMKILQFAFDSDERNEFLPHNYPVACVAYTGTHDNDTTIGWWHTAAQNERTFARRYLGTFGADIAGDLIEGVWASRAMFALTTLQDLLRLDTDARMNIPGVPSGNWDWRFDETDLTDTVADELRTLNRRYQR